MGILTFKSWSMTTNNIYNLGFAKTSIAINFPKDLKALTAMHLQNVAYITCLQMKFVWQEKLS